MSSGRTDGTFLTSFDTSFSCVDPDPPQSAYLGLTAVEARALPMDVVHEIFGIQLSATYKAALHAMSVDDNLSLERLSALWVPPRGRYSDVVSARWAQEAEMQAVQDRDNSAMPPLLLAAVADATPATRPARPRAPLRCPHPAPRAPPGMRSSLTPALSSNDSLPALKALADHLRLSVSVDVPPPRAYRNPGVVAGAAAMSFVVGPPARAEIVTNRDPLAGVAVWPGDTSDELIRRMLWNVAGAEHAVAPRLSVSDKMAAATWKSRHTTTKKVEMSSISSSATSLLTGLAGRARERLGAGFSGPAAGRIKIGYLTGYLG